MLSHFLPRTQKLTQENPDSRLDGQWERLKNTQEELSKFISNFFYLELYYNADPMTPGVQVARAECGESVVPTKVTPDMKEKLTKTISQEELSKAILAH